MTKALSKALLDNVKLAIELLDRTVLLTLLDIKTGPILCTIIHCNTGYTGTLHEQYMSILVLPGTILENPKFKLRQYYEYVRFVFGMMKRRMQLQASYFFGEQTLESSRTTMNGLSSQNNSKIFSQM